MRTAAVAALSTLALSAATATAQAPGPAPGCFGTSVTDKKGDVEPHNADITSAWFDVKDGKTLAHIQVADLDDSVPNPGTGVRWYFLWTWDGAEKYVAASKITAAGANGPTAFTYGTRDADGFGTEGNPPGTMYPGPDGVIQIEIPPEVGGDAGQKLGKPHLLTYSSVGMPGVAQTGTEIDTTGNGKDHTIGGCPAAGPPAPAPGPGPAPQPPSGGGGDGVLHVSVSKKLPRAKKVKRSLAVKLTSKETVTNITASLKKGAKKVGSGKLARVQGSATLKLKVKKLKKGAYTLDLHGINADGGAGTLSVKLKLR